eukprot:m.12244 g.12244  ORF g.12244 m.12244 type:complete len:69 (+) comp23920_c0_seq2:110-316(+)
MPRNQPILFCYRAALDQRREPHLPSFLAQASYFLPISFTNGRQTEKPFPLSLCARLEQPTTAHLSGIL